MSPLRPPLTPLTPLSSVNDSGDLRQLIENNAFVGQLFSGKLSAKEFFTESGYAESKEKLIALFDKACPDMGSSKFGKDNLVAAWITKLRL